MEVVIKPGTITLEFTGPDAETVGKGIDILGEATLSAYILDKCNSAINQAKREEDQQILDDLNALSPEDKAEVKEVIDGKMVG